MFALLAAQALLQAAAPGAEGVVRALQSPAQIERERAQAQLSPLLTDPDALRALLLACDAAAPEVELRLAGAIAAQPAAAPALVQLARGDDAVAARARAALRHLLVDEVARRISRDQAFDQMDATGPYSDGTLVGDPLPVGEPLPLEYALLLLDAHLGSEKPLALDPALDRAALAPVRPAELLPSTAGGMLRRWLAARKLDVIDLGIVRIVTSAEIASAFQKAPRGDDENEREAWLADQDDERRERHAQRRRADAARFHAQLEVRSAEFFADRLLGPHPVGSRYLLLRALRVAGAAEAAASLAATAPEWSLLACGARAPRVEVVRAALTQLAPERDAAVEAALALDLGASPASGREAARALIGGTPDEQRFACCLARTLRAEDMLDALRRCAGGSDRAEIALEARLALLQLAPGAASVEAALRPSPCGAAALGAALLRGDPVGCAPVTSGSAPVPSGYAWGLDDLLAGARAAAEPGTFPRSFAHPLFAAAGAGATGMAPSPSALAPRAHGSEPALAALVLARWMDGLGKRFDRAAAQAAAAHAVTSGDPLWLDAVETLGVLRLRADDDAVATALWLELRHAGKAAYAVRYESLSQALNAPERGRDVLWLERDRLLQPAR